MADVARKAGVHATTVSLALRNHPSLPPATRQRLQQLAHDMGYQRDPALSALVAYRRLTHPPKSNALIAYITHWESRWGWKQHPAHLKFFEGANAKSAQLGYRLEHFWLGEPDMTHRRMSRILYARGITGIILASHRREWDEAIDFEWEKFGGVKIDFAPIGQQLHIVTNDQRTIMALAVQRALAAGYRRIGVVMPYWWDQFVDLAWSAGFLAEQQLIPTADRVPILFYSPPLTTQTSEESNFQVPTATLAEWMQEHEPEVILSYGPFVRNSLAALGLAVPKDVAFVELFLEQCDGSTAGVRENCERVGELAVEILVGQLQQHAFGIPAIPTATLVEGTWCDGRTMPLRSEAQVPATSSRRTAGDRSPFYWRNRKSPLKKSS